MRWRAILFLTVVFVGANGWAALMLYTMLDGTRATAHVTSCTTGRGAHCDGTWRVPGGGTDRGRIHGATVDDEGHDVPVRLGPLGAYDGGTSLGVALLVAGVADVALVAAIVLVAVLTRRTAAAARRLEAEPGAHLVLRVGPERATDLSGTVFAETGPAGAVPGMVTGATGTAAGVGGWDGLLVRPLGGPPFVLDRRDPGTGEPGVAVLDTAGAPVGSVRRWHERTAPNFALLDGAGQLAGVAARPPDSAFNGAPYLLTLPDRRPVGRLSLTRSGCVLRLDRPVDEPLRTLLLGLAFDLHRLLTTRPVRRGALATGRGWQDPAPR